VWWLVPLAVGASSPLMVRMNLRMAAATGPMESAVVLHLVGLVAGLGFVAAGWRERGFGGIASAPWWTWLAGAIGVSCMALMNSAMPRIGAAGALAVAVAGQLGAALLFEQAGLLGDVRAADPSRWAGVLLLVAGAWLVSR
jgi:bacterial/archaeal transporter family-2 protein